jgi:hypothetical protein
MITLKESLLDKTSKKIAGISDNIKNVALESLKFPKFEEQDFDDNSWCWTCPKIFKKLETKVNKAMKANMWLIGAFCYDYTFLGKGTTINLYAGECEGDKCFGTEVPFIRINMPTSSTKKDVYDLFAAFALHTDEMMDDILKEGKKSNFKKPLDIYDELMKKYGKL